MLPEISTHVEFHTPNLDSTFSFFGLSLHLNFFFYEEHLILLRQMILDSVATKKIKTQCLQILTCAVYNRSS